LYPIIAGKTGYGESFDPEERLTHNDKSIKESQKRANNEYKNKKSKKHGNGKWIEFLYRTVPYDITRGTGMMDNINLDTGPEYRLSIYYLATHMRPFK